MRIAPSFAAGRRVIVCCLVLVAIAGTSMAQGIDAEDRPISAIRIEGLSRVPEQLVRNQLRSAVGDPYSGETVLEDIRRITRLGEFKFVDATYVVQQNGGVELIYTVVEQAIVSEIQVVGNRIVSDQDLLGVVRVFTGLARDDYLIEKAKRSMEELYRARGYYLTTVTIDDTLLVESGILLFRVIEGPRVKVRAVEFQNCRAFTAKQLKSEVKTRSAVPLLRKGVLDQDVLDADVAALDRFYKDRGYLDIRVGKAIDISPDNKEVKVTFIVEEGRQFRLRTVRVIDALDGGRPKVFAPEQIEALLEIRSGDVFSRDLVDKSVEIVHEAYGRLGYLDVAVDRYEVRSGESPEVDLQFEIDEGARARVGMVNIGGNFLTRDKVIRRLVRLKPGRQYDATETDRTLERINNTRLFNDVRVTVQAPDELDPEYRDLLVEIKERNTGAVNFAFAVGSDSGAFGEISLNQANFDVADVPETLEEFIKGKAFRGAGQRFNMTLRPGSEFFQYSASILEPHLFESEYALRVLGSVRDRQYDDYDEERATVSFGVSRRLGDIWELGMRGRVERVELTEIDADAPTEIFEDAGPDNFNSFGVSLTRTTIPSLIRPGRGSRLELSYDRVGVFGGDFQYNVVSGEYTLFVTLEEDFLGRKTTLKANTRVGYIFGGDRPPTYEQFYLGGRSFRGFGFREISPKGIRADDGLPSDDPVGGEWLFFAGLQYEFPLYEQALSGVFFVDSGTVTDDVGFDQYRVSIGTGVRITIPFLGPVPLAFDFAVPLVSEDEDDTQVFSFTAELPF